VDSILPSNGEPGEPTTTDGCRIAVLGPLHVEVDGTTVRVSAARERAVLSRLAMEPERAVSDTALIDAVWSDDPPASARATLQTYVSHLRRLVGADTIAREANGYRLAGASVDVDDFTADVAAARASDDPTVRADRLRRALARWRGGAFDDLAHDHAAGAVRAGLDEQRLGATELLLETRLDTEDPAGAVPELEELCAQHPRRERAAALLMLALYRAGRQADALAVHHRLRDTLLDELGLDPGPEVQALEGRILAQDPTLLRPTAPTTARAAAPPTPTALPLPPRLLLGRTDTPLVGRRRELERLEALLQAAATGGVAPTVVLRGEAGIGKTRLAREVALSAAGRGWLVTWGRCPADAGGGFQPYAEALDHLVRWRPDLAAGHEGLLASVLPALAARATDPLALLQTGAEQRFAVLEALSEIVARAAAVAPVLVVLDDLHWADPGSTALTEHLANRRLPGVVVVATARSPEPTESPPFVRLLEQLARDHDLTTLDLVGLSEAEVRVLVDRSTGEAAPVDAVAALHGQTRGNPFFVGEVLAALGDDGIHRLGGEVPLTAGVQAVLAQRLDHLSPDAEAVLAAAAAIGADFDLASCATCADVDEDSALRALEAASAMALVEESGAPGTFSFSHALVRAAVTNRTPRTRHARLVERAATVGAERTMAEPGALGRRITSRLLAGPVGATGETTTTNPAKLLRERDPRLAFSRDNLLRIAAGASPLLSNPGVEVVVASDLTTERSGRTVLRWAESMSRRGESGPALARAIECGELARQLESASLLVDAALVGAGAAGLLAGRATPEPRPELQVLLTDALGALGQDPAQDAPRARVLVHLAMAGHDLANRRLLSGAARAAAARAGSARWEAEALLADRSTRWGRGSAAERLALDAASLALAEASDDIDALARCLATASRDNMAAGDPDAAADTLERLLALPKLPAGLAGRARLQRAGLALFVGDTAAAADALERAAGGDHVRSPRDPYDPLATLLLVLAIEQGQLPDARTSLRDAAERWPDVVLWTGALAAAECEAGDDAAVLDLLDRARPLVDRGCTGPGDVAGMTLLLRAAEPAAHRSAETLRRILANHQGELAVAGDAGVLR